MIDDGVAAAVAAVKALQMRTLGAAHSSESGRADLDTWRPGAVSTVSMMFKPH